MSYHNGSVWPHDNALIAAGFVRYGLKAEALRLMTGLFDASLFFDLHRLPELFCGFHRRPGESPTHYPVSCAPQAWASGSALLLLQASLNLRVLGAESRVVFARPVLPAYLDWVSIHGLRLGEAALDLEIARHGEDTAIAVPRRDGAASRHRRVTRSSRARQDRFWGLRGHSLEAMNRRGNIKLSASGVWAGATGKGARMKVRAPNRVSHTYRQRLNGSVSKVFRSRTDPM